MREELKIFDENRNEIGIADRSEVHKKGHWHETFHCWFVDKKDGIDYIYFQKRSDEKKDFPTLLDITAAGHIMSNESVSDGIREVKEELGIDVQFEELISLGVIEDCIVTNSFIDRELGNVYLYHMKDTDDFNLQKEEVSGIVKTEFNNFSDLCLGKQNKIIVEGFKINELGKKIVLKKNVSLDQFVPHQKSYLEKVVKLITYYIR
ncbi:NUDIX domain-containing protein [Peribacillus sp. NPDC096622]|uniref:NUDIX hydrolase n=1 Tax=Peribacillus sp. NPDC096622 TaxID=3364396 RepID=UPI00381FEE04